VAKKNGELIKTTRKNVVLFSHLDLDGRSGEGDVFVIFLLLASSDARFFSPMMKLLRSFLFICKTQAALELTFKTCSDKSHKSSMISNEIKLLGVIK